VNPSRKFKQRPFPNSPKGLGDDGLQDYRSFPLGQVVNFDIVDVDFSGARSVKNRHGVDQAIYFSSCRCRRVRFNRAGRLHMLQGVFDDCSFDGITTDHCGFTGLYRDCSFARANLRRAMLGGDFVRCVFDHANLQVDSWGGVSFSDCSFRNCSVSPLFPEVGKATGTGDPVSFSVLVGGGVRVGEIVQFRSVGGLLHGWGARGGA
jgi:hypothetical protein